MRMQSFKTRTCPAAMPTCLVLVLSLLAPGLAAQTPARADEDPPFGWKQVIPAIAGDQKQIWTFPVRAARGNHWVPTLGVVSTTAAVIATDSHDAPYFRKTDSFDGFNSLFSGDNTQLATIIAPVTLYAAGLIRKDSYQQKTALLAGVAAADSAIVTYALKGITSRIRPRDIPPSGDFRDTWFKSDGNDWLRGRGSFPSGHTVTAFSIATVVSRRYPNHRWVPYVAYGLAAVVGFSRVSLSAHFPSDVFMGAALGYSISRFAVLQ